jgi:hypothetical protein
VNHSYAERVSDDEASSLDFWYGNLPSGSGSLKNYYPYAKRVYDL